MPEPLTGPAGHDMTSSRRRVLVLSSRDWDRSDAAVRETAENRRIISEATLRLTVNGSDLAHLLCLRQAPVELALGHLLTEGLVSGAGDIEAWRLDEGRYEVHATLARRARRPAASGQARPDGPQIALRDLWTTAERFSGMSAIRREVGGVHSALFRPLDPAGMDRSVFFEDVGRHNCLDKIAGRLLLRDRLDEAAEGLIFSSGRVSTEMLSKALALRVPVYVSLTTPTAPAVDMARRHGLTLLGYVRGGHAVVYSGGERVRR